MDKLTAQDQEFVKQVAITGNQTQSAKKAYGIEDDNYANVKAQRLIRKDTISTAIQEVKRTIAEQIPDELLVKVHLEGLNATKTTDKEVEPDYAVRHKYLDTALKLKGVYETDENNINILMPVLVKFLDKDNGNSNRDTD